MQFGIGCVVRQPKDGRLSGVMAGKEVSGRYKKTLISNTHKEKRFDMNSVEKEKDLQKQEKWRGYGQDIKAENLVNGKETWSVMR